MNVLNRQRDTPTRSPFAKSPNPRSPTKPTRQELGLSLQQVIGTTCGSVNCFDIHASSNSFVYTAGAAAVIATIDQDLSTKQRFFRAHASLYAINRPLISGPNLQPPSNSADVRSRLAYRSNREDSPFNPGPQDATDSPGGKSGHARDRVKAATALSISRNGRWLAVGETGYKPRVLIFPVTEKNSTDSPVTILSEHSYGVHAVAFSPDSKLLATLGTINDGFLYIWEVDEKTGSASLIATNKCTSVVKQIAWMGRSLVTVGVRFIKVWRPDDPSPISVAPGEQTNVLSGPNHKPLAGRNSILNTLVDSTFVAVTPLSATKAIVCTDAGHICILDDSEKQQRLMFCTKVAAISTAIAASADELLVGTNDGQIISIPVHSLSRADTPVTDSMSASPKSAGARASDVSIALGPLRNAIISVDNNRHIQLRERPPRTGGGANFTVRRTLSAHSNPVLGIRSLLSTSIDTAKFLTWSAGGSIMGWTADGRCSFRLTIQLEQVHDMYDITNELRTVSLVFDSSLVVAGDKYGVLKIVDTITEVIVSSVRAHASDITDVAVHQGPSKTYIVSSSRDRSIQVFLWSDRKLNLIQTLDEHAGAVTGVLFTEKPFQMISCSADRTIVIRHSVETPDGINLFMINKTVNLKSSPTSMRLSKYENTVLVSTSDRQVHLVNMSTGRITHTFKASDGEGGDAVILSSLVHVPSGSGPPVIAGVSSTDKSIRLYTEDGTLLARDTGHTEGVTDIALIDVVAQDNNIKPGPRLVTVAADGTIFIWDTTHPVRSQAQTALELGVGIPNAIEPASPITRPPLRKVISSAEIIRLHRAQSPNQDDNESTTPSALRPSAPARLRKKPSRLNVTTAPRLEPRSPIRELADPFDRSRRSPSPSRSPTRPPRRQSMTPVPTTPRKTNIQSLDGCLDRTSNGLNKTSTVDPSRAELSTDTICGSLRAFRQHNAQNNMRPDTSGFANLALELEATLSLVRKMQGTTSDLIPSDDSIEELTEGLSSVDLLQRFAGLRKKSSERGPRADEQCL